MEQFLNTVAEKINKYRATLESEGLSGDELEKKVVGKFNEVSKEYYTKMMGVMSEDDYQIYKREIGRKDKKGVQAVLAKYTKEIEAVRQEIINSF